MTFNFFAFLQNLVSALFLWFGLFLLTRRKGMKIPTARWNDPLFLISILLIMISWQFLGVSLRSEAFTAQSFLLRAKATWWVSPICMFLWCRSSFLIFKANTNKHISPKKFQPLLTLFGIFSVVLAFLGTFTEWIFQFSNILPTSSNVIGRYHVPPGKGGIVFVAYLMTLACISLFFIYFARKGVENNPLLEPILNRMLIGDFVAMSAIALIMISGFWWNMLIPEQIGDFLLTIGFIIIAVAVVKYHTENYKRISYTDLLRSFGSVTTANFFYILFYELFSWHYRMDQTYHSAIVPSIVFLTTLIHTPLEWGQTYLDRLIPKSLIPDWERKYLEKIDQIQYDVLTTSNPRAALENAEEEFQKVALSVRKDALGQLISTEIEAIFQYKEFEKDQVLAQSKLFALQMVSQEISEYTKKHTSALTAPTLFERAEILRGFLASMVSQLCLLHDETVSQPLSQDWIGCFILQEKYIHGKSRKEIDKIIRNHGYQLSGGGYSRYLQNGRKLLSEFILQTELEFIAQHSGENDAG